MEKREISVSAAGLFHMMLVEERNLTADDFASLVHEPRYMVMDRIRSPMKQGIIERENHGNAGNAPISSIEKKRERDGQ